MTYRRIRQILNASVLLSLFLLPAPVYAVSLELRWGAGDVGFPPDSCAEQNCTGEEVKGSYQRAGANVVFSPWKKADMFAGAEYTASHELDQYFEGYDRRHMHYSFDYSAVTFGVRYKPFPHRMVKLHLMLGGLAGKAEYRADLKDQPYLTPLSGLTGSEYFIRPQAGIGAVITLTRRIGFGFEAAYAGALPAFTITVLDTNTGQIENKRLNSDANMFGITVGLQYRFGE